MKVFFTKKASILLIFVLGLLGSSWGQTIIFSENIGAGTTTEAIAVNTFQNTTPITFNGTGDTRVTTPSSGYTGFSGGKNVFITNTVGTYIAINGLNTTGGYSSIVLSFGFYKSGAGNISSANFVVEYATDYNTTTNTGTFTSIPYTTVTTGAAWSLVTATGTLPSRNNLTIRFRQNQATQQIRVDDIKITGVISNVAPTASAVVITGTTVVGQTLTGSYTYADAEGNPEGTSTFKWYRANDAAGTGEVAISGATATTYTLTGADLNKFIRFSVVPVATTGTLTGVETFSGRVGPVTSNNNSTATITVASGFTATPNVPYINFVGANVLPTSHELARFSLNDVAGATDDGLTTTLTALTMSLSNSAQIERVALYDNSNTEIQEIAAAAILNFTGLNIIAPSGSNINFSVRVTYKAAVTDNVQNQVTITSATANIAGTVFAAADAGGASSSIAGDDNRIQVVGDRLRFGTQPTSQLVNTNLLTFSVNNSDANSNIDLDAANSVVLTTSGIGFSSSATYSLVSGSVSISDVVYNQIQSNITITATTTGLGFDNDDISNLFSITNVANGTYRTTAVGGGTWGTATWERVVAGTWTANAAPATSTTDLVIIRHIITSGGSISPSKIEIEAGGKLTITAASTIGATSVQIYSGGILQLDAATTIPNTGGITVDNGGTYIINYATASGTAALWGGTENFKTGSTVRIDNWNYGAAAPANRVIQNPSIISVNTAGYIFGNLIIGGSPSATFVIIDGAQTIKLTENDFTSSTTGGSNVILTNSNITGNTTFGGNIIVTANIFSFASTTNANPIVNVLGNIQPTGGTINLNQTSSAAATVIVQLKGHLLVSAAATLTSSDAGCSINFSGTTTQDCSVATTAGLGTNVQFIVENGAYVRLINQNLPLTNASNNMTVNAGGTLDFNYRDITGSGSFDLAASGGLRITSASGVNATTAFGNVLSTGTRTFSQSGYYYFVGNVTPQSTGNVMTAGSTAKRIFIDKTNNTDIVNLTQSTGTTDQLTINKGIFVESVTASVSGSGALNMSAGSTYRSAILNTTLPQLTGTYTLSTNTTVELNGAGIQQLRGGKDYFDLIFSNTGTKSATSNPSAINGTVFINNTAVFDASTFNFGQAVTGLNMTGGRLILGTAGQQPIMDGLYSLTAGVIEFANTNTTAQTIRPKIYQNIEVTGSNVANSNGNIVLNNSGSFTVKTGGVFTINDDGIVGLAGTQTVTIESGGTFNTGDVDGFSGATNTSINSNIETVTLATNSTVNYTRTSGNQTITNALPYQNIIFSGSGTKTAPAGTLTVLGNFTKNNVATVFNANGGMVAFNGTGSQVYASTNTPSTIKTATTFYDVTIGNTAGGLRIDADSMNVDNSLTLGAAAKLDLGTGYVILKSTAARTAYIAPVVGGATITYSGVGRFEIERYLFAKKSWRSLATPIDPTDPTTVTQAWRENGTNTLSTGYGTQITGPAGAPAGFDQTTIRGSLKSFDMNLGDFVEVINTSVPLYNRSGYFVFVRGDRAVNTSGTTGATTLRMQGKLVVGTQSYTVLGDKFLSVGNPFAARINMKQAIANTRTGGMVEAFTVWNPNSPGSFNVGAYETYIRDISAPNDYKLNGTGAVNNFVESGQAVFIQAIGADGGFAINEADKLSGSSLVSRGGTNERTGVTVPTLEIALHTNDINGTSFTADAALLNFGNFNDAVDAMDVKKTFNTADNIAIKVNNQYLVAERKTMPQANDSIFLHIASLRTANYSFAFDPSLLGGLGLEALLVDRFLGTSTPVSLTDVSTINFTTTTDAASKANNRFAIVFKPAAVLPVTFTTITAVRDGGSKQIAVKWDVSTEVNINRYEVERSATGTNFITLGNTNPTNNTGSAATYVYNDAVPLAATNYYRVKAISNNGTVQYSAVVKVAAVPSATGFVVYPNPVVGNTINLQANQVAKGAYSVQLVNATGQIIYKGAININSNSQSTSIVLDAATAPGKYTLVLVGAEGKVSVGVVVR